MNKETRIENKEIKKILTSLNTPVRDSHKGQNGKLLIIGGSHLFHSASLWSLKVASRIVDLVHYSSVDENNKIVQKLNEEFRDGIVIPRAEIDNYIGEDDCILIGPGMVREEDESRIKNLESRIEKLEDILKIENEGVQTYYLTKYLLLKYSEKKWVIDAGSLQMLEPDWIPKGAILTPHHKEFDGLESRIKNLESSKKIEERIKSIAKKFNCVILHKGKEDLVADKNGILKISGGNQGMTKGGTGDVLAGLVAAFYCKNDAFTAASAAAYINKKAGEDLAEKMGIWFNASDLADQIPQTMKKLLLP